MYIILLLFEVFHIYSVPHLFRPLLFRAYTDSNVIYLLSKTEFIYFIFGDLGEKWLLTARRQIPLCVHQSIM